MRVAIVGVQNASRFEIVSTSSCFSSAFPSVERPTFMGKYLDDMNFIYISAFHVCLCTSSYSKQNYAAVVSCIIERDSYLSIYRGDQYIAIVRHRICYFRVFKLQKPPRIQIQIAIQKYFLLNFQQTSKCRMTFVTTWVILRNYVGRSMFSSNKAT